MTSSTADNVMSDGRASGSPDPLWSRSADLQLDQGFYPAVDGTYPVSPYVDSRLR